MHPLLSFDNLKKHSSIFKNLPDNIYKFWKRDITVGEKGCFNSHLSIIDKIRNKNNDETTINLILEDDAYFDSNFFFSLKEIYDELMINDNEWDICFLGRNRIENKYKSLSENIEHTGYSYNAHCYLVSNKVSKIISEIDTTGKIIPYDEFLPALAWSHPRQEINKLYLKKDNNIHSYSTKEQISYQKGFGYSDIN